MRWGLHLSRASWGSGLGRIPRPPDRIPFLMHWSWPPKGEHPLGPLRAFVRYHRSSADTAPPPGRHGQLFQSTSAAGKGLEAIHLHRQNLAEWFSRLPREERQFGPTFALDTVHVDPVIRESTPDELLRPSSGLALDHQSPSAGLPPLALSQLFNLDACGRRVQTVVLYGTVGTGKSTLVRKMVLDWCYGRLPTFKLVIPFSCEDLSSLGPAPASLCQLVAQRYPPLKEILTLMPAAGPRLLFVLHGLERLNLDFRLAGTALCSDLKEPAAPAAIIVNLLRKYMLPEASILVTTRPSAIGRIPSKYVGRYGEICGFSDTNLQKLYFQLRLNQPDCGHSAGFSATPAQRDHLVQMLSRNLEGHHQIAAACFLPSYCWLVCATLHFLHAPTPAGQTLTSIYTSFLRLNFSGETLDSTDPSNLSLMAYAARTMGKLAYEGVSSRKTYFSEEDVRGCLEAGIKTEEEFQLLHVFHRDALRFFLAPCVEPGHRGTFVFTVPAMQEYLAALYIVLGLRKTTLQRVGKEAAELMGRVGEDVSLVLGIVAKLLPLRILPLLFNLLKVVPQVFGRLVGKSREAVAQAMVLEMFREEDYYNDDVLDQMGASILGVEGPRRHPDEPPEDEVFELFPMFMGGLLSAHNRAVLAQLGCPIKNLDALENAQAIKKKLGKLGQQVLPPSELLDHLFFHYEFQNQRFSNELLSSLRQLNLAGVRMTPLKCTVVAAVLGSGRHVLDEVNFASCQLDPAGLRTLMPVFLRARKLGLQLNSLGPEACRDLRDLLLHDHCQITTLRLSNNPLTAAGVALLLEGLKGNTSLTHLSLLHTGLGDEGLELLAAQLDHNHQLQELNVAYNGAGDKAALALAKAAWEHPSLELLHLYFNELSSEGRQVLRDLGGTAEGGTRVVASLTEGAVVSEYWSMILSEVQRNLNSWDWTRVRRHLELLLRDLEDNRDLQDTASLTVKFKFNPKLGIDNPVLSLAEDYNCSDPWNLHRPRFCLLSKEEGRSFGFHLQQQLGRAGHVVCRVEPGTSAHCQGLQEGDQILAVNNNVVEHEDHVVVVRHIRASGPRVLLTVLARHVYDAVRAQQGNDTHLCPVLGSGVRPRLCHVVKDEGGFGFSVTHGAQGPFWLVLSTGGAAERAGVPPGARLLEVNGVSVEKFTHYQLSRKVHWLQPVPPTLHPSEQGPQQAPDFSDF